LAYNVPGTARWRVNRSKDFRAVPGTCTRYDFTPTTIKSRANNDGQWRASHV
jgi:hypothetical protein